MAKKLNLNDYLGHNMNCTCGEEHKTNLKIVDIDKNAVARLPKHIETRKYMGCRRHTSYKRIRDC